MSWHAYQERLSAVCLEPDVDPADLNALGAEPWRWEVYRRMVRNRFRATIVHAFERSVPFIGDAAFDALVAAFLATSPPRSPYLRDVPGEFLRFVERGAEVPAAALDMMRYEWADLATAYTPDAEQRVVDFDMSLPAALTRAHRLLHLTHTVHRDEVVRAPVDLVFYRDSAAFDVHVLELSPITFALLDEIARERRPLTDVIRTVAERAGATLDVAFVDALSAVLADFLERRLLLGSVAAAHPSTPA